MDPTAQHRLHSIKLWPPSQSTRQVLVDRIIKNLTTPSILSRKYGLLSIEEAEEDAKRIESAAFNTANQHFEKEPDGDGSSAVQLYAKESSTLMVEAVKRGPTINTANQHFEKEPDGDGSSAVQLDAKESSTLMVEAVKRVPTINTANQHFEKEPDGDGSSAVQLDAKESSTLMVEAVKRGPTINEDQEPMPMSETVTVATHRETFFDISGGNRDFLEETEARELLKPLQTPGNGYTKIRFSNRSFTLDAARVAAPILVSLKDQLTEVDLSDIVAGRLEDDALEVMTIFSSALNGSDLRYLNLSDNALGEKGIRAFEELLSTQSNLEELYLINNGISEEAANAVCELIPSTKKLKILHFHNNMTGDEGAVAISKLLKKSPLLEDFRCSSTRVCSDGGVALAEALATCTHLKKLDLRDNVFGVEAGIALSKSVSVFTNLTELYLSYLNLENSGTLALVNALVDSAPSLEVIDMAGNEITSEAAPGLAAFLLAKRRSLTKINLSENELEDEGTIVIAKVLEEEFPQLTEVDLSVNAIRRAGARVLAQAVVGKPGFKLLNIDGNFLSDEGVDEVKEMFKNTPDMLGSFDENDPEGQTFDGEDEEDEENGDGDELGSKMKGLEIKQEE